MKIDIKIPSLGENITEGTVGTVFVKPGDTIQKEQALFELESEKATADIPSPGSGKIISLSVSTGDTITIGQLVGTIEQEEASAPLQDKKPSPEEVPEDHSSTQFESKSLAQNTEDQQPESGDTEQSNPVAINIEDKKTELLHKDNSKTIIPVPASPSIRRMARELGVDVQLIKGSGKNERILAEDIKQYVRSAINNKSPGITAALPDLSVYGEIRREKMSGIRKSVSEHITHSWNTIPHVTQFDEANVTQLENFRQTLKKDSEFIDTKVTITGMVVRTVASALKSFSKFTAAIDTDKNEIIYRDYIHIGIAVNTAKGLLVPVIRNADKKNLKEISNDIVDVSDRAKSGKLSIEEMKGSSFSISNLGALGTTHFTPIINYPDSAILGIGRSTVRAVYKNDIFTPELFMPLSLSYDHRLIDGADAAIFLRYIAEALENPWKII